MSKLRTTKRARQSIDTVDKFPRTATGLFFVLWSLKSKLLVTTLHCFINLLWLYLLPNVGALVIALTDSLMRQKFIPTMLWSLKSRCVVA